ncbi:hypothetical protein [Mucilaginibacter sp. dw_454]|nr:hypothetical protein [Mucilaginibacter sp. dw_454]
MKNIAFVLIITLSLGILTSCSKKETIKETLSIFSFNPYTHNNILATAD